MPRVKFAVNKEAKPHYPVYTSGMSIGLPSYKPKLGGEFIEYTVSPHPNPGSLKNGDFNHSIEFNCDYIPVEYAGIIKLSVRYSIESYHNSRTSYLTIPNLFDNHRPSWVNIPDMGSIANQEYLKYKLGDCLHKKLGFAGSEGKLIPWPTRDIPANYSFVMLNNLISNAVSRGDKAIDNAIGAMSINRAQLERVHDVTVTCEVLVGRAGDNAYNYGSKILYTPHSTPFVVKQQHDYNVKSTFARRLGKLVSAAKAFESLNLLRPDTKKDIGAVRRNLVCIGCLNALVQAPDEVAVDELLTNPTFVYNAVLPWYNYRYGAAHFKMIQYTYKRQADWGANELYYFLLRKWGGKMQLKLATGIDKLTAV